MKDSYSHFNPRHQPETQAPKTPESNNKFLQRTNMLSTDNLAQPLASKGRNDFHYRSAERLVPDATGKFKLSSYGGEYSISDRGFFDSPESRGIRRSFISSKHKTNESSDGRFNYSWANGQGDSPSRLSASRRLNESKDSNALTPFIKSNHLQGARMFGDILARYLASGFQTMKAYAEAENYQDFLDKVKDNEKVMIEFTTAFLNLTNFDCLEEPRATTK